MKCALSQKLTFISLLSPCAFMGLFRYFIVKVNKRGGRKQKVIVLRSRENTKLQKNNLRETLTKCGALRDYIFKIASLL